MSIKFNIGYLFFFVDACGSYIVVWIMIKHMADTSNIYPLINDRRLDHSVALSERFGQGVLLFTILLFDLTAGHGMK